MEPIKYNKTGQRPVIFNSSNSTADGGPCYPPPPILPPQRLVPLCRGWLVWVSGASILPPVTCSCCLQGFPPRGSIQSRHCHPSSPTDHLSPAQPRLPTPTSIGTHPSSLPEHVLDGWVHCTKTLSTPSRKLNKLSTPFLTFTLFHPGKESQLVFLNTVLLSLPTLCKLFCFFFSL